MKNEVVMSTVDALMSGASGRAKTKAYDSGSDIIPEGYSSGRMKNYTPQQMKLHESQFAHLGPDSYLSRLAGGDQSMFDEMEAPAFRQFQGLQGQIASRFSGMGMGGRKSSGFQNTSNQAASDFAQDLQSKRLGLRNQAIKDLMSMSNELLGQRPYEKFLTQKPQSAWADIAGKFAGAIPGAVSSFASGGWGGGGSSGSSSSNTSGSGYDQEFRMDPSRMGY